MAANLRLIVMTFDEVEYMIENPSARTIRDIGIAPEAAPPGVALDGALKRYRDGELWYWCAPRLFYLASENLFVGSGSLKNSPRDGAVEIGYGVATTHRGRNIATNGVELLVAEGFSHAEVSAMVAETAEWNIASQRVLEKAGFVRTGSRNDAEDGPLFTWRRARNKA